MTTPRAEPAPTDFAEDARRYQRDGYVVSRGLLSAAEVSRFGAAIDAEVARRTAADARTVAQKSTYEQSFVQCMRLWETDPDVAPLTFHRSLAACAAALLDVPQLLLWQDQALYKEPAGRATTPHQDAPFWPIGNAPLVSAWIPLVDVTREMGCMAYVPGSHKAGSLRVVDITHRSEPYAILDDPALGGAKPQYVEAKVGDVIWHDGFTVHLAGPNNSDAMRRAFTVVYLAAGQSKEKAWPCFPLDRAGVEVGQVMQGEGLPVVWPRAADDIPDPSSTLGGATGPQQS